jgi:hypothetical protein
MCLTDFTDWRYIHSWLVFSTQLGNCCPMDEGKCSVYTESVWLWWGGGGGGVLSCVVDHILQEFNTLFTTRFRTYKIAKPPRTKMTSKDDIKGLVFLKFLCPWLAQLGSSTLWLFSLFQDDWVSHQKLIKNYQSGENAEGGGGGGGGRGGTRSDAHIKPIKEKIMKKQHNCLLFYCLLRSALCDSVCVCVFVKKISNFQ